MATERADILGRTTIQRSGLHTQRPGRQARWGPAEAPPLGRGAQGQLCTHCGLPASARADVDGRFFCCAGCEVVYHALQNAGLDGEYYRLRDVGRIRGARLPAQTEIDPLLAEELDSEWFLHERVRACEHGALLAELNIDGIHCAACLWLIEQMPQQVVGVRTARLDLARARMSVTWDPETTRLSEIVHWLARFGYRAHPVSSTGTNASHAARERRLLLKLGVAWALAGNVMLIAFAMYSGLEAFGGSMATAARWLSLALAVPAVLYGGSEFYPNAFRSIALAWHKRTVRPLHMDVPITLGIAVGFLHSAWATSTGQSAVWFDSITVLIAALLTARWLQERSRRIAGDAADRLLALIPSMARRVSPRGQVEIVRTSLLEEGDLIEVHPEEVFPADGFVVSGESSMNNAVLTGESSPLTIATGTLVHAGAMNLTAVVRIRIQAAGEASRVGRLLAWMQDPDAGRAPVVMLADRIGGYFVTGVVLLAVATGGVWLLVNPSQAALHVAALLVITCPCALGMATPLAMTVAVGRAARIGVFVKNEGSLQELSVVDCFVIDKTGTLTEGRPSVVEWFGDHKSIEQAAALERHSSHVLAKSLSAAFPGVRDDASDVRISTGNGVIGLVAGREVQVGSLPWVTGASRDLPLGLTARAASYAQRGLTPVAVAVNGRMRAVVAFGDPVRESAPALIAEIHARGAKVYLATGDNSTVAYDVGTRLGIPADRIHGEMSPEEKLELVRRLQSSGNRVAVIGDGVNDAAALRVANVGIAVGVGASASFAAADVFLMQDALTPVLQLLRGAGSVMRTVKRNLRISLIYNALGAGAAVIGVVTPLLAAVAMPLSSLIVVGSSVLQRSFSQRS